MSDEKRRALKVREKQWVSKVAARISRMHITPNQISLASVVFALLAAGGFVGFGVAHNPWYLLVVAVMVQLRLLCNLFDGLVAIEGGKSTPSGELFNDVPDRFADVVILVSLGYAAADHVYAVELGWAAGVLAVMTAYARILGTSLSAPTLFIGPMAKQHRMALVTGVCLLAIIELWLFASHYVLYVGLWVLVLGSAITVYRRLRLIRQFLEQNHV
ncbi:CDP-alcohol phosphatidyltransferase family protein [Marinicella meishanensis]|uniref:CDP-alcohol phosphatidyltransferase family protein n=1 Tax=Marinicella meishanensis TaxID=2873263 RepID=UPI001CBC1C3D|nr:CDP-alcohol phosphatidyltransferase family protein [Marinicella sp. NBU2979]